MDVDELKVQALRPDREVMTRQRLPYFMGISGQTVGARGLSMHIVVIPPGLNPTSISDTRPASMFSRAAFERVGVRSWSTRS
jgi:uncharacterized RmlC-like cupin family protein